MGRVSGPAPWDVRWSNALAQGLERYPRLHRWASLVAHSADSPLWVVGLAVSLVLPVEAHWKYESLMGLAGIFLAAVVVQSIKWSVRRPRPVGEWGQGYRRLDPHSFPSGHAARVFFLAVAAVYVLPAGAAALVWVWAVGVCVARVALKVHYLSDVGFGAACGMICGLALAGTVGF